MSPNIYSPKRNKSVSPLAAQPLMCTPPGSDPDVGLCEVLNHANTYNPEWGWMGEKNNSNKPPICEKGDKK